MMAMARLEPNRDDSLPDSPMFKRWVDGSDIIDNAEDEAAEETIPDDMPLSDLKVLAVCGAIRKGLSKTEALVKYKLEESYFDENVERVSNS